MASPFPIHAGLQISTAALATLDRIQSAVGCHLISASDVLQNLPPVLTRLASRIILPTPAGKWAEIKGALGRQKMCLN